MSLNMDSYSLQLSSFRVKRKRHFAGKLKLFAPASKLQSNVVESSTLASDAIVQLVSRRRFEHSTPTTSALPEKSKTPPLAQMNSCRAANSRADMRLPSTNSTRSDRNAFRSPTNHAIRLSEAAKLLNFALAANGRKSRRSKRFPRTSSESNSTSGANTSTPNSERRLYATDTLFIVVRFNALLLFNALFCVVDFAPFESEFNSSKDELNASLANFVYFLLFRLSTPASSIFEYTISVVIISSIV